jgi:hypothetical protein
MGRKINLIVRQRHGVAQFLVQYEEGDRNARYAGHSAAGLLLNFRVEHALHAAHCEGVAYGKHALLTGRVEQSGQYCNDKYFSIEEHIVSP